MRIRFSIATLILLLLPTLGAHAWQTTQKLDHFEVNIAGSFVDKLPTKTEIRFNRNPDHHRDDERVVRLKELPAVIPDYSFSGCVAEFWAPDNNGVEEKLFSIVVDREMFDRFRVVTLLLDKPKPLLRPDPEFWASLRSSPKITQRMRYVDLPWFDKSRQLLAPMPDLPNLVVRRDSSGELVERIPVRHNVCQFDCYRAEFAEETQPKIRNSEKLRFSVTYDSGGLFEPINNSFLFKYSETRHRLW